MKKIYRMLTAIILFFVLSLSAPLASFENATYVSREDVVTPITAVTTVAATANAKTVKEGNAGKVEIYRGTKLVYAMSLANGKSSQWQKIVDNKTTALLTNFMGKDMLADHASQGLKAMKNCKAGDRLVITKKGKKTTYKMTTKYTNGKNTGAGILIGKKYADEMKDGNLFAYCCNDSYGKSVTVTFWKKQ